jgi:hypothetical protein
MGTLERVIRHNMATTTTSIILQDTTIPLRDTTPQGTTTHLVDITLPLGVIRNTADIRSSITLLVITLMAAILVDIISYGAETQGWRHLVELWVSPFCG